MEDTRQQMIAQINTLKEIQRRRARRYLRDFLPYVNPKYSMQWFHRVWETVARRVTHFYIFEKFYEQNVID